MMKCGGGECEKHEQTSMFLCFHSGKYIKVHGLLLGDREGEGGEGRGFPLLRVSPSVVDIFLILGDLFVPALLGAQKQPQRNALLLLYLWEQPGFPK